MQRSEPKEQRVRLIIVNQGGGIKKKNLNSLFTCGFNYHHFSLSISDKDTSVLLLMSFNVDIYRAI